MKINDISVKKNLDVSKELEVISFKVLSDNQLVREPKFGIVKNWMFENDTANVKDKNKEKDQFSAFQRSMKVLLALGLCIGLNPVTGLLQKDVSKIRFTVRSWIFVYAVFQAIIQTLGTCLNFYRMFTVPAGIRILSFVIFFATVACTTIFFIRIATKWPNLLKELSTSRLDEYVDPRIIRKCNITCILLIFLATVEHVFSIISKWAKVLDCSLNVTDFSEEYFKFTSPWFYELNVQHNILFDIILQFINLTCTAVWNYSDVFVVCISMYLTSILKQINKKIASVADKSYIPSTTWSILREDYTRATRIIRLFDDTVSSIVLVSFASNLFFICLQLFYVLATQIRSVQMILAKQCPNYPSGPLRGYEYPIYTTYSFIFLFMRFLTVSLVTAGVNSTSLKTAPTMYGIPSTAYTKEVERFLNQVNNSVVALSGLQFFYVTKELVLSVAGTIVTYELVLLQFNNEGWHRN